MVQIEIGTHRYKAETCWEECSPKRMMQLSVYCRIPKEKRNEVLSMEAVGQWLGMPRKQWIQAEITPAQYAYLKKTSEWVWQKPTRKPFAFLRVGSRFFGDKLYLPSPEFEDTTALELSMAFIHYTLFAKGEQEQLDKLIATLCRPRAKQKRQDTDDVRMGYSEYASEKIAKTLQKVPIEAKIAILNYFEGMLEDFMKTYQDVFGIGEKSRYDSGLGMLMVLKSVAQQGHFGTYDAVCQQPVNLLWTAILDDVLTQKEQEEKDGV